MSFRASSNFTGHLVEVGSDDGIDSYGIGQRHGRKNVDVSVERR